MKGALYMCRHFVFFFRDLGAVSPASVSSPSDSLACFRPLGVLPHAIAPQYHVGFLFLIIAQTSARSAGLQMLIMLLPALTNRTSESEGTNISVKLSMNLAFKVIM